MANGMKKKLTPDELRCINAMREGQGKCPAYKKFMLSEKERKKLSERAILGRTYRFFDRPDVIEVVRMPDEEFAKMFDARTGREDRAREKKLMKAVDQLHALEQARLMLHAETELAKANADVAREMARQADLSADQAFFESLQMSKERPDEIILTGTARFILKRAIAEIQARSKAIHERGVDPMDKEASAFTNQSLKAVQIGVSILENRTERYLSAMENNDSVALELLNRSINSVEIKIEDYTAPIPATALAAQTKEPEPEKQAEPADDK